MKIFRQNPNSVNLLEIREEKEIRKTQQMEKHICEVMFVQYKLFQCFANYKTIQIMKYVVFWNRIAYKSHY